MTLGKSGACALTNLRNLVTFGKAGACALPNLRILVTFGKAGACALPNYPQGVSLPLQRCSTVFNFAEHLFKFTFTLLTHCLTL